MFVALQHVSNYRFQNGEVNYYLVQRTTSGELSNLGTESSCNKLFFKQNVRLICFRLSGSPTFVQEQNSRGGLQLYDALRRVRIVWGSIRGNGMEPTRMGDESRGLPHGGSGVCSATARILLSGA